MRLARSTRRRLLAPLTLAVLALTPAAANATVTTSSITSPSDPVFGRFDTNSSAAQTFDVAGTSNGTTGDTVDVLCFFTNNHSRSWNIVASGVEVQPDGSFTAPGVALDAVSYISCTLRAVPSGSIPTFLSPFTGPSMHVGWIGPTDWTTNGGISYGYEIEQTQPKGLMEWQSAGDGGLIAAQPYSGGKAYAYPGTAAPWSNAGALRTYDGFDTSEIVVDAHPAYDAASQNYVNSGAEGRGGITSSSSINPANGNLTITERSVIQRCTDVDGNAVDGIYPGANCAKFAPTGVTLERTIVQDHEGQMGTVTDRWISTDAAAHKIKLGYDNQSSGYYICCSSYGPVSYRLPGEESYAQRNSISSVEGLASAPATLAVAVQDSYGDVSYGGLTYTTAPDGLVWTSDNRFVARYTRDIPASGELRLTQMYTQGVSDAQIKALGHAAEDKAVGPAVSITAPANGSTVSSAAQTVTGTATDNGGVTALTVSGQSVTPAPGGAFSMPVALAPGQNTITVVAADAEGNSTQAQTVVTYVPVKPAKKCNVPNVKAKKLDAAKKAIKKAGCVVGKLTAKASKKVKPGRVISQGRKAGRKVAIGTKVNLTVSKPKPVKKHSGRKR